MATSSTTLELTLRGRVLAGLGSAAGFAAWLGDDPNARLAAALLLAPLLVDFLLKPRRLHRCDVRVAPRRTAAHRRHRGSRACVGDTRAIHRP